MQSVYVSVGGHVSESVCVQMYVVYVYVWTRSADNRVF